MTVPYSGWASSADTAGGQQRMARRARKKTERTEKMLLWGEQDGGLIVVEVQGTCGRCPTIYWFELTCHLYVASHVAFWVWHAGSQSGATLMSSPQIIYRPYSGESDLPHVMALVQSELSEPYVVYTFRYFLHQWSDRTVTFLSGRVPLTSVLQATSIFSGTRCGLVSSVFLLTSWKAYSNDPAKSDPIGVIVCKQSMHRNKSNRGYIAMLSVDRNWRNRGIGSSHLPYLPTKASK